MPKQPLVKCGRDDPDACERCIANEAKCIYLAIEGTKSCARHGGGIRAASLKTKAANQYRLGVWQSRLNEFAHHDGIKSLRDEIGILRMVLEEQMKKCHEPSELLMFSARIQGLTQDIQKLVTSCDRLERNMGSMMDKPTAIQFAAKIITILGRHVDDGDILDEISHEILEELR